MGRVAYIRDHKRGVGRDGAIIPSKLSRKIFPRLLDAFQRGRIVLALNAVHTIGDFIHKSFSVSKS
jgi:hypothetical protein